MSLILDALKKSEQERRRERGPDLQSIHRPMMTASAPARRNGWLLFGAALLTVNVAAAAWWLLRDSGGAGVGGSAGESARAEVAALPAPVAAPAPQATVSASGATPVTASAAALGAVTPALPPANGSTVAPVQPAPAPTTIAGEPEFTPVAPGSSAQPSAPVQELWELPEAVRRTLPPMTYSFHVYSSDPQRRTIIINNRRLREGEQVANDLLLEEITPDGVVLAVAGYRVHIAVLGEW